MSSALSILISLSIIWGSSFWLIKVALGSFSPDELALLRISIAGYCLLGFSIAPMRRTKNIPWRMLIVIGFVGSLIPALLFSFAQQHIPSALAGMVNSLQPLFTLLIAVIVFSAKWQKTQAYGILLGFLGAVFLAIPNNVDINQASQVVPILLVMLAALCYSISTNIIRQYCRDIPPILTASLSLNLIALPLLPYWLYQLTSADKLIASAVSTEFIAVILLSSIGTAFALILFNRLVKLSDAAYASTVTYLIPIVALIIGWLDNEEISTMQILGLGLILFGVMMVHQTKKLKKQ